MSLSTGDSQQSSLSLNLLSSFKDTEKSAHFQVQIQLPFFKYIFSNRCITVCPYFASVFKKEKQPKILAKQDTSLSTGKRETLHGMAQLTYAGHMKTAILVARMPLQEHIPGLSWTCWTTTTVRVTQGQTHLCFHTKRRRRVVWKKLWVELGSPCKHWEWHLSWSPWSPSQPGVIPACWSPRMGRHIMNACKHDTGCACTGGTNGGRKVRSWNTIPRGDEVMPIPKAIRVMWKAKSLYNE